MIVNCKERFGYTYLWSCDRIMCDILGAFCEGHGYWWNAFLGWRKTDKNGREFYWIPSKKLDVLIGLAEEIKNFQKNS